MIVSSVASGRGCSVFAVDPGETTGWAWACIGWNEVGDYGVHESLRRALKDRGGYQLGDSRVLWGQVICGYSGDIDLIGKEEWQAAETLVSTMEMCGEMGSRRSGGAVPRITHVVIEDFILRERTQTRDLLSPVRITAALYVLLCQHSWKMKVVLQSASDKSVINDDRLRRLGLWATGQQHARDANRHLTLWLRKNAADRVG